MITGPHRHNLMIDIYPAITRSSRQVGTAVGHSNSNMRSEVTQRGLRTMPSASNFNLGCRVAWIIRGRLDLALKIYIGKISHQTAPVDRRELGLRFGKAWSRDQAQGFLSICFSSFSLATFKFPSIGREPLASLVTGGSVHHATPERNAAIRNTNCWKLENPLYPHRSYTTSAPRQEIG